MDKASGSTDGKSVRVPHIGWNDLEVVTKDGLLRTASAAPTYYFVHSYVLVPRDPAVVSGYTTHGVRFASTVEVGNIFGTQFHPEKSQRDGLALLGRFLELAKAHAEVRLIPVLLLMNGRLVRSANFDTPDHRRSFARGSRFQRMDGRRADSTSTSLETAAISRQDLITG